MKVSTILLGMALASVITFSMAGTSEAGQTVFANGRGIAHKGSGGFRSVFPDVVKTPSPGGPIPIPYPNIAKSSGIAKGSKKVKNRVSKMITKKSNFKMSNGDQPGVMGGIISSKIKGKANFLNYSFDVKISGKNQIRARNPLYNHNSQ